MTLAFWADEAIAAGVASHSLTSIPRHVVAESSPPLYYMLVHVWTSVAGSSDTALHLLSLLFAAATVPVAGWAAWTLFGRRAAWITAVLVVVNTFPAIYGIEARMYTLAMLLTVPTVVAYVQTFVFRRRRWWPVVFVVSQTLLLYTHNWALLLGGALTVASVPLLLWHGQRRRFAVDAVLTFGAVAVLYAAWVPSLLEQVRAGLQPWGMRATPNIVREDVVNLLGGRDVFLLVALGAALGLLVVVQARRWTKEAVMLALLVTASAFVLIAGWRVSVWSGRYLTVVLVPLLLVVAVGIARGGDAALAALVVAAFLSAPLGSSGPDHEKSNARLVGTTASEHLRRGDLVVVADPHVLPLMARYLPDGLRYATAWGAVRDEHLVEWRDFMSRLTDADPAMTVPPLVAALPPGAHVAVFCPPLGADPRFARDPADRSLRPPPSGTEAFDALRGQRCTETTLAVSGLASLREVARFEAFDGIRLTPVEGRVFVKG